MKKQLKFINPDFEKKWEQASKIPEFKSLGKKKWTNLAATGYQVEFNDIKDNIENLNFFEINEAKKTLVEKSIKEGFVETPIAVKLTDIKYDVIAGKTTICELLNKNINPQIWIIDISNLIFLIPPLELCN